MTVAEEPYFVILNKEPATAAKAIGIFSRDATVRDMMRVLWAALHDPQTKVLDSGINHKGERVETFSMLLRGLFKTELTVVFTNYMDKRNVRKLAYIVSIRELA